MGATVLLKNRPIETPADVRAKESGLIQRAAGRGIERGMEQDAARRTARLTARLTAHLTPRRGTAKRGVVAALLLAATAAFAQPPGAVSPAEPPASMPGTRVSSTIPGTPALGGPLLALADPWCPFNCQPEAERPGYVVEMLREVFAAPLWQLSYRIVPWDRALQQVVDGQASLALAMTRELAIRKGLLIGREPVGSAADCLFVAAGNPLQFHQSSDLDSLHRVGVVSGYEYDYDLGAWLAQPKNRPKIVRTRGANPAEVNARNLARGRLDGVIESAAVMQMQIQQLQLQGRIREAGCQQAEPLYVAFSPRHPQAARLVEHFDQGVAELRRSRRLARILARYGLQDWKAD